MPFSESVKDPHYTTSIRFMSLGDFGVTECERKKAHHECEGRIQASVAAAMDQTSRGFMPHFILSLGDGFYPYGVKDIDDDQLYYSFDKAYNLPNINDLEWKITIGDHDHCGNVSALLAYGRGERGKRHLLPRSSFNFPNPYYHRSFTINPTSNKKFHLIVTDSVALEGNQVMGGERRFASRLNETYAGEHAADAHWDWLESILMKITSTVGPKIIMVVGHRPVLSRCDRGRKESENRVSHKLANILEKYGVSLYMHGHDHIMQHHTKDGVEHFGNGVGGFNVHRISPTLWPTDFDHQAVKQFTARAHGFAMHEIDNSGMTIRFVKVPEPDEVSNSLMELYKFKIPFS